MQILVKTGLVSFMLVSCLAAREQAVTGNPVTISSGSLEITFNGKGSPERGLAGPDDEPIRFRTDLPVLSVTVRDAQGKETAFPLGELRAGIPYAERMQAEEIYLPTQTWRTDGFWPGWNGHVHVNWNPLRTMSVSGSGEIPTGPTAVSLKAASSGPKPWLEIQITTQGEPMVVTGP